MFWPNPPIAILKLPNCSSHRLLTFLKRFYWLVGQEYNKHVTTKDYLWSYSSACSPNIKQALIRLYNNELTDILLERENNDKLTYELSK